MEKGLRSYRYSFAYYSAKESKLYIKGLAEEKDIKLKGYEIIRLEDVADRISEGELEEWELISSKDDKTRRYFEFKVKLKNCCSEEELKFL